VNGSVTAVTPGGEQETIPPSRPLPPRPGVRRLGSRYVLDERIGRGATGHVWSGRRDDGLPVAVKLLRSDLADDPEVVTRFLREKATLMRLRHPNLVQVHDLVAEGDVLAIVMDLVDGEDLRRRASRGRLSRAEAAVLLAQTAGALAAVHAARIVHRDVKPENVLVTQVYGQPTAKLTDFGIARALESPSLTRLTQIVGTPAYIAPEIVAGRPAGPPADVYALGVTSYELLAGRRPFDSDVPVAVLRAHVEEPVVRPPGLDDDVWALLAACLDKRPEARPSAADLAVAWAALSAPGKLAVAPVPAPQPTADTLPPEVRVPEPELTYDEPAHTVGAVRPTTVSPRPVAPPAPPPPAPPRRRRWPVVVAAVLVAVLGVSIGVYAARRGAEPAAGPSPSSLEPAARYFVPASVKVGTDRTATLTWDAAAAQLPGFEAFYVWQLANGTAYPLSGSLAATVTSFTVAGLRPGRESCFGVLAYGVTEPPPKTPPKVCIDVPSGGPA